MNADFTIFLISTGNFGQCQAVRPMITENGSSIHEMQPKTHGAFPQLKEISAILYKPLKAHSDKIAIDI